MKGLFFFENENIIIKRRRKESFPEFKPTNNIRYKWPVTFKRSGKGA
jgi:hypothetical protein